MATNSEQDNELREFAKKSLKKKREAWQLLVTTITVNLVMTAIWWFTTPNGYFWPLWVIFGMGLATVISFYDAYLKPVNRPITDEDIDAEVAKLKQRRR